MMIGLDPATFCKAWGGILYMLSVNVKLKSVLLYKILNENYSPCLRDTLVRLRDLIDDIIYETMIWT